MSWHGSGYDQTASGPHHGYNFHGGVPEYVALSYASASYTGTPSLPQPAAFGRYFYPGEIPYYSPSPYGTVAPAAFFPPAPHSQGYDGYSTGYSYHAVPPPNVYSSENRLNNTNGNENRRRNSGGGRRAGRAAPETFRGSGNSQAFDAALDVDDIDRAQEILTTPAIREPAAGIHQLPQTAEALLADLMDSDAHRTLRTVRAMELVARIERQRDSWGHEIQVASSLLDPLKGAWFSDFLFRAIPEGNSIPASDFANGDIQLHLWSSVRLCLLAPGELTGAVKVDLRNNGSRVEVPRGARLWVEACVEGGRVENIEIHLEREGQSSRKTFVDLTKALRKFVNSAANKHIVKLDVTISVPSILFPHGAGALVVARRKSQEELLAGICRKSLRVKGVQVIGPRPLADLENIVRQKITVFGTARVRAQSRSEDSENDVAVLSTNETISLLDPVSLKPLAYPGRSERCSHSKCFDVAVILEQTDGLSIPTTCPMVGCSVRIARVSDLRIDGAVLDFVRSYPGETECELGEDGKLRVLERREEKREAKRGSSPVVISDTSSESTDTESERNAGSKRDSESERNCLDRRYSQTRSRSESDDGDGRRKRRRYGYSSDDASSGSRDDTDTLTSHRPVYHRPPPRPARPRARPRKDPIEVIELSD